ncbi:MAG: PilZ domain-containing protein [Myxococcota bacterium]
MTLTDTTPRRLLVTLRSRAAFDDVYVEDGVCGALWVGQKAVEVGQRVELEIVFVQELMIFHIRGSVDRFDEKRGKRVSFEAGDERARDVILSFVRGERSANRRARRFPVALPVSWADGGEFFSAETVDLSASGASIRCATLPSKGSLIAIRFVTADGAELLVRSEVVWRRSDDDAMFGVMFIAGENEVRESLDTFLAGILGARTDAL